MKVDAEDPSLSLAAAALLCAHGLVAAQVGKDVAEEMVRKSGLWEQLGHVAPQVKAGIVDAASKGGSPLAGVDMEQLRPRG